MRWPWDPKPCRECITLKRRLDDLELDLEHLAQQMVKLRGRVTGQLRRERAAEGDGGSEGAIVEEPRPFNYVEAVRLQRARRRAILERNP